MDPSKKPMVVKATKIQVFRSRVDNWLEKKERLGGLTTTLRDLRDKLMLEGLQQTPLSYGSIHWKKEIRRMYDADAS